MCIRDRFLRQWTPDQPQRCACHRHRLRPDLARHPDSGHVIGFASDIFPGFLLSEANLQDTVWPDERHFLNHSVTQSFDKNGSTINVTSPLVRLVGPTLNFKLFAATPNTLSWDLGTIFHTLPSLPVPTTTTTSYGRLSFPPPLPLHRFSNLLSLIHI